MSSNKSIVVFEHSRLNIGDQNFTSQHFEALAKFNDLHKTKYFELGYQKISFKSYVGVIQVGNRTIEVLPKADNLSEGNQATKDKWQHALLQMLKIAGYIKLNQTSHANQHTSSADLLDVYLYSFLKEVEQLIHAGLVKKYKRTTTNGPALKGRLLIKKQLQHNIVHKERFYTEHTLYDRDHQLNRILKTALDIIKKTSFTSSLKIQAANFLLYFEDIQHWQGNESDFEKIKLSRKTLHYRHALDLAKMIIVNYCPDMKSGKQHVLALLFDMNKLFEKFIFKMIKGLEEQFRDYELYVTAQNSNTFWAHKTIRPDIIVTFKNPTDDKLITSVIDTKWKIVDEGYPSVDDLKQMYTYNMQLNAEQSVLLYPSLGQKNTGGAKYSESLRNFDFAHSCEMYFVELFDANSDALTSDGIHALLDYILRRYYPPLKKSIIPIPT